MATITFSGLASGIDSTSLIKSLLDQKRKATIAPLEKQISSFQETNAAFAELTELLDSLKDAASKFREINGGALSKTLTSSDETKVTGSASNLASNGSYSLNVISKAKNHTMSFDDRFSSLSETLVPSINNGDPAADRTVTYTVGTGSDQVDISVELDSNTTVESFISAFNNSSTNNGRATASAVNVGTTSSPSYAIVITTNNEGTQKGQITSVSVGASVLAQSRFSGTLTEDAASDAEFTMTGISGTITRSSNTVTDLIEGVTFEIQDTGSSQLTIGDDPSRTVASLQDFVDAYNEVVRFINDNDIVSREEDGEDVTNIFGPLASSSLDNNILSALRNSLNGAGTSGRTVNILADLGITTERDGTLAFDTDAFKEALANDSEGVRLITQNLGEDLASVNGTIANFTRFNGLIDLAETSNTNSISSAQDRIDQIEKLLGREEESLVARFARLEALIGKMTSQQSELSALLG